MNCSNCGKDVVGIIWGDGKKSRAFCSAVCYIAGARTPTESDPHGLPPDAPGAKLDAGKPMAGMMLDDFASALLEVAKVSTYGAGKYSRGGWKHVEDGVARYKDAMLRHQMAAASERIDPASGLQHYAHVAWNALAILTLMQQEGGDDAR